MLAHIDRRSLTQFLVGLGLMSAGRASAQAKTVEVVMRPDMRPGAMSMFEPETVRIAVGDTVRWKNEAVLIHTATFDPAQAIKAVNVVLPAGVAAFGSADLLQDDTYSHTFTTAGSYKYVCKYHEEMGMIGTVVVG